MTGAARRAKSQRATGSTCLSRFATRTASKYAGFGARFR